MSGTKHDQNKAMIDLIPARVIFGLARAFTYGFHMYGAYNWRKGIKFSRLLAGTMRHLWKFWGGEELDRESGLPHLDHAQACIAMLREMCRLHRELDDRPDVLEVNHIAVADYSLLGKDEIDHPEYPPPNRPTSNEPANQPGSIIRFNLEAAKKQIDEIASHRWKPEKKVTFSPCTLEKLKKICKRIKKLLERDETKEEIHPNVSGLLGFIAIPSYRYKQYPPGAKPMPPDEYTKELRREINRQLFETVDEHAKKVKREIVIELMREIHLAEVRNCRRILSDEVHRLMLLKLEEMGGESVEEVRGC